MKNILVIGHSSGIGKALTQLLSADHKVCGTYFSSPFDFESENVTSLYLNVLDEKIDFSFLPEKLDGLVYCPGAIQLKPFSRFNETDFLKDYQLQVLGAVKCIQACLPHLKKGENSSIVLFSTVAVKMGFNFHSLVSASKGAIEGLTKALAAELAPTIRVNCVAPSITNTRLASSLLNTPEKKEANAQRHPLKKIGEPEDLAKVTAFLLSENASWITGQIISVDGGMSVIK